jgi:SnoaL-like protein
MSEDNIASAEAYYRAFNDKDLAGIARRLHPDVQFVAPFGESSGRATVLEAAKRLLGILKSIEIRARFGSGDQVMLAYDLVYGEPAQVCHAAVLMNFQDGLIARIELFYDARPFGNL